MFLSATRVPVTALLSIAVVLISEQQARADDSEVGTGFYYMFGGSAVGAVSIPFLVAYLAYAGDRQWLPPGWQRRPPVGA